LQNISSFAGAGCTAAIVGNAVAALIAGHNLDHFGEGVIMFRTLLALALVALFAVGCNTMSGAGKDIERGGEKIQDAAERNK
jgi:predicted small secreted protein